MVDGCGAAAAATAGAGHQRDTKTILLVLFRSHLISDGEIMKSV